jgi:hypothetical protein
MTKYNLIELPYNPTCDELVGMLIEIGNDEKKAMKYLIKKYKVTGKTLEDFKHIVHAFLQDRKKNV